MRLLKDNNVEFEPFHSSLQFISRDGGTENGEGLSSPLAAKEMPGVNLLEKYSHFMQNILSFEKQTTESANLDTILVNFRVSLKRILPLKEAGIFFIDESRSTLAAADGNPESAFSRMVNNIYKESIIDWIFENGKPTILPDVNNFTAAGAKLNFIIQPISEEGKKKGILAILTPLGKTDIREADLQSVQILLNMALSKIEQLRLRGKLNRTYNELQTYQAKLSNDFRLSAIGELTEGIVEDIKSPLQVILSYADLLVRDEHDQQAANVVKEQVKKINFVINRLVKFSSINEEKTKIYPCDINHIVSEYYNLVKSSLDNAGIECVLDFEKDIPSILSSASYIYQLLSNIISIIKSKSTAAGGGIIIQTRYASESILIKIINTANLQPYRNGQSGNPSSSNLNFRIVENIMKLHEGDFSVESFQKNSSIILLRFPLRRKIRQ